MENCIHCRALPENCAPQWDRILGRTPAVWGAWASLLHNIFTADWGSSTAGFRPPGCSLFFLSPLNRSPSILFSLGTLPRAHSLGESAFDWSRADAAPQQRSHGNHCQGDRALLCGSVSNFTEARMVPNLPSLCFSCPKSPCSLCFVCFPPSVQNSRKTR